jgi:hypothetical protein
MMRIVRVGNERKSGACAFTDCHAAWHRARRIYSVCRGMILWDPTPDSLLCKKGAAVKAAPACLNFLFYKFLQRGSQTRHTFADQIW